MQAYVLDLLILCNQYFDFAENLSKIGLPHFTLPVDGFRISGTGEIPHILSFASRILRTGPQTDYWGHTEGCPNKFLLSQPMNYVCNIEYYSSQSLYNINL